MYSDIEYRVLYFLYKSSLSISESPPPKKKKNLTYFSKADDIDELADVWSSA